jgi:hypothetical protein
MNSNDSPKIEEVVEEEDEDPSDDLRRCKKECCSTCLWYRGRKEELLVPLMDVSIEASMLAGLIKTDIHLTYVNSESDRPV